MGLFLGDSDLGQWEERKGSMASVYAKSCLVDLKAHPNEEPLGQTESSLKAEAKSTFSMASHHPHQLLTRASLHGTDVATQRKGDV